SLPVHPLAPPARPLTPLPPPPPRFGGGPPPGDPQPGGGRAPGPPRALPRPPRQCPERPDAHGPVLEWAGRLLGGPDHGPAHPDLSAGREAEGQRGGRRG